jgi:hypothetical protein
MVTSIEYGGATHYSPTASRDPRSLRAARTQWEAFERSRSAPPPKLTVADLLWESFPKETDPQAIYRMTTQAVHLAFEGCWSAGASTEINEVYISRYTPEMEQLALRNERNLARKIAVYLCRTLKDLDDETLAQAAGCTVAAVRSSCATVKRRIAERDIEVEWYLARSISILGIG